MAQSLVPSRAEIAEEQTWNQELVFASRELWREEYSAVAADLPALEEFPGTLAQGSHRLAAWFELSQTLARRLDKLMFYAFMASSVDSNDAEAVGMGGQAQGLYSEFAAKSAFAEPELLSMEETTLREWVKEERLQLFAHELDRLFRMKPHVRSAEVEEVLGYISDPFSSVEQTFEMLSSNDLVIADAIGSDGTNINVTQSNIEGIKSHSDREIRRSGMSNYADAYLAHRHTFATNYVTAAKQAHALARIRSHESVLEMSLTEHNLPSSVFHTLIDTFRRKLPVWHRYWEVKRRLLKLDAIRPYDIWAPLTSHAPAFTFPNAVELIANGMAPLGEEYVATVRRGCLEERWVDYAVNQGKRQGAFSYGTYDTHPCIMTSFDGSLAEVSTLAHELGHSMHTYFTVQTQPYHYSEYSMFVAEVASNFNQAMVRAHLFERDQDRDFQLAVIQEAMDNIHRYFFIMPTLARFEWDVYQKLKEGEPLTADSLQETMGDLFAEGYGDALMDDRERTSITWATFGHLYVPFYTFQYATGISAAHALCKGILDGRPGGVDSYLRFLSLGSSVYPLDALKIAGVDMTTPEPIEAGFAVLEGLIDRLESLIE